ncbi:MAG: DUF6249 domain-containing protein [Candidatus Eiseniibacteriota bacterium]
MVLNGITFDSDSFLPFLVFAIPIVAIVGGITAGIVKTISEARIIENAQRERLAAIERGIDPSKLPPLPTVSSFTSDVMTPDGTQRRSNGLLTGGLVTFMVGLGISITFFILEENGNAWAVGLIPAFIGLGLLFSWWLTRPKG